MADKKPTTASLQPEPKIIENPPASSVEQALKNSQAQVDAAKAK
jgi:hypothetical protein